MNDAISFLKMKNTSGRIPEKCKLLNVGVFDICDEYGLDHYQFCSFDPSQKLFRKIEKYENYQFLANEDDIYSDIYDFKMLKKDLNITLVDLYRLYLSFGHAPIFSVEKTLQEKKNINYEKISRLLDRFGIDPISEKDTIEFNEIFNCNVDFVFYRPWNVNGRNIHWIIFTDDVGDYSYPSCQELPGLILHVNDILVPRENTASLKIDPKNVEYIEKLINVKRKISIFKIKTDVFSIQNGNIPMKLPPYKVVTEKFNSIIPFPKISLSDAPLSVNRETRFNKQNSSYMLDLISILWLYEYKFGNPKNISEMVGIFYGNLSEKCSQNLNLEFVDDLIDVRTDFSYEEQIQILFEQEGVPFFSDKEISEINKNGPATPDFIFKSYMIYNDKINYWMEMKTFIDLKYADQIVKYLIAFGSGIYFSEKYTPELENEFVLVIQEKLRELGMDMNVNENLTFLYGDTFPILRRV